MNSLALIALDGIPSSQSCSIKLSLNSSKVGAVILDSASASNNSTVVTVWLTTVIDLMNLVEYSANSIVVSSSKS